MNQTGAEKSNNSDLFQANSTEGVKSEPVKSTKGTLC